MWFVILALLIVAAYFVYDALRDRRLAESGNTLSSARRMQIGENPSSPSSSSGNHDSAAGQNQSQTFVNPQEVRGTTQDSGAEKTSGSSSIASTTAVAGAAVAGVAGVISGSGRNDPASGGKLHFLDAPIGQKDDLTLIDGIGPVIEGELNTLGIYHYHQIGNFSDSDVDSVNAELDFPGRIERESWVPQARKLMTDTQAISPARSSSTQQSAGTMNAEFAARDAQQPTDTAAAGIPASAAATVGAVATGAALASSRAANTSTADEQEEDDWSLTEADFTGAWNTDLMVEIQERLKVLNTRESDAPRLNISREDYRAIKDDDDERFSREQLSMLLDRLREL